MKKLNSAPRKLPATALVLALLACALLAQGAWADQVTIGQPVANGFDAQQLSVIQLMGLEVPAWMIGTSQALGPRPSDHPNFPLNCADYSGGSCGAYIYPGHGCCCVPAAPPAGFFCPDICV